MTLAVELGVVVSLHADEEVEIESLPLELEFQRICPPYRIEMNFLIEYTKVAVQRIISIELLDEAIALNQKHVVSTSILDQNLFPCADSLSANHMVI
jgi:hypothetical protein